MTIIDTYFLPWGDTALATELKNSKLYFFSYVRTYIQYSRMFSCWNYSSLTNYVILLIVHILLLILICTLFNDNCVTDTCIYNLSWRTCKLFLILILLFMFYTIKYIQFKIQCSLLLSNKTRLVTKETRFTYNPSHLANVAGSNIAELHIIANWK